MSTRDDRVSLGDMLRYACEARDLLGNARPEDLGRDRVLQLALTRRLEIIGEAANRVSAPTQQANPQVPWAQIIGTRHRLVHGYDVIDYDLLWDTITHDLPSLIAQLQALAAQEC